MLRITTGRASFFYQFIKGMYGTPNSLLVSRYHVAHSIERHVGISLVFTKEEY